MLCTVLKSKWSVDLFICFSETVISPIKKHADNKTPVICSAVGAVIYFVNVMCGNEKKKKWCLNFCQLSMLNNVHIVLHKVFGELTSVQIRLMECKLLP